MGVYLTPRRGAIEWLAKHGIALPWPQMPDDTRLVLVCAFVVDPDTESMRWVSIVCPNAIEKERVEVHRSEKQWYWVPLNDLKRVVPVGSMRAVRRRAMFYHRELTH